MYRWLIGIALVLAAFAGGVWIGWRAGESTSARQAAKAAHVQLHTLTQTVQRRIEQRTQQQRAQHDRSIAWLVQEHQIHVHVRQLSQEIDDVALPTIPVVDNPCSVRVGGIGSVEFKRLYNAAARAGQPATAGTTGRGYRMHVDSAGTVPGHAEPAAGRLESAGQAGEGQNLAAPEAERRETLHGPAHASTALRAACRHSGAS